VLVGLFMPNFLRYWLCIIGHDIDIHTHLQRRQVMDYIINTPIDSIYISN
jgi:hypothetical protein